MATLTSPHILESPVSVQEEGGVITSLTTVIRVTAISGSTVTARLADVYNALDSGGYTAFSSTSTYTHLSLMRRDVEFLRNQTTIADATLEYKARGMGGLAPIGQLTWRLSSSLQQIDTQFDVFGNQIILSHTYPADDENYPNETKQVTATVQQMIPQGELIGDGLVYLSNPIAFRNAYIGHINAYYWNGGAPGTWLCSEINITPHTFDASLTLWALTLAFQYDPSGWAPLAVFTDPTTNKPPVGLIDGVGVVNPRVQPYADFWEIAPG
jgi:hypothetical protein